MSVIGSAPSIQGDVFGPENKTITFDGTGNLGQTGTAATFFTVTGEVMIVALVPICTGNLTLDGVPTDGTLALGITGSTALFVAATNVLDININTFWVDTVPDANGVLIPAALKDIAITDDIIATSAGTDNCNGGSLRIDVYWRKLGSTSLVVPA